MDHDSSYKLEDLRCDSRMDQSSRCSGLFIASFYCIRLMKYAIQRLALNVLPLACAKKLRTKAVVVMMGWRSVKAIRMTGRSHWEPHYSRQRAFNHHLTDLT